MIPPWATKVKNVEIWFKSRKAKFSDEVEKTQSAKTIIKSSRRHAHGIFESNGRQEIYYGHFGNFFDDLKTPAVIKLDSCDIKPAIFKYSPEN